MVVQDVPPWIVLEPGQRQPSEHLWAVRKDGRQLDCEVRDHGAWGVEVQVYRDREFLYGGVLIA
jgi:hypothetical protein